MRRRSISKNHTDIELFPFLSILACTIGTLILLIIVLTTQALDPQEAVVVAKTEEEEKGVNKTKTPRYIECREDEFVLHPGKITAPRADLYDEQSPLRKTITELKKNKDQEYLIVILRPDGIEMFQKIRALVEKEKIDIGYEPLEYGLELKIEG
ncbi:MAG: hypothetical protein Tsb0014_35850 [Pleurocapsa sp.]